ncbi:hypothetical protein BKA56DRAFT_678331 [Ilyonectria sp. MPI-CAGE-AT-0026]|nr:hypothetical protein BKA56DRAFT_678331 [Ilyonectria sp. MPI-CAGE-AT-0026]
MSGDAHRGPPSAAFTFSATPQPDISADISADVSAAASSACWETQTWVSTQPLSSSSTSQEGYATAQVLPQPSSLLCYQTSAIRAQEPPSRSLPTSPVQTPQRVVDTSDPSPSINVSRDFQWIQESPATARHDGPNTEKVERRKAAKRKRRVTEHRKTSSEIPTSRQVLLSDSAGRAQGSFHTLGRRQQPRAPFKSAEKRKETALTRTSGACMRCRYLKVRCQSSPDLFAPCQGCAKVSISVGLMPCFRSKIVDAVVFRNSASVGHPLEFKSSGLGLSKLYRRGGDGDVGAVIVELTQDIGHVLTVAVSPFVPTATDKTGYTWTDHGGSHTMEMPCYQLMDQAETLASIQEYIKKHGWCYFNTIDSSCPILWDTFQLALQCAAGGEKPLVQQALNLWAGCRMIERLWRVCGDETLGIEPVWERSNPWHGIIPITPIMDHQLDRLITHTFLLPLKSKLLSDLHKMIYEGNKSSWFQIYLVVFILLHNTERLLAHCRKMAKRYGIGVSTWRYFSFTRSESYFHAAKTFLAHFHFASRGQPLALIASGSREEELVCLSRSEVDYLQRMVTEAGQRETRLRQIRLASRYETNLFWCHQMFLEGWEPAEKHIVDDDADNAEDTRDLGYE